MGFNLWVLNKKTHKKAKKIIYAAKPEFEVSAGGVETHVYSKRKALTVVHLPWDQTTIFVNEFTLYNYIHIFRI